MILPRGLLPASGAGLGDVGDLRRGRPPRIFPLCAAVGEGPMAYTLSTEALDAASDRPGMPRCSLRRYLEGKKSSPCGQVSFFG